MEATKRIPEALKFTYNDYLLLPEDKRYEIIEGELYMTPSPKTSHQRVLGRLFTIFTTFVREKGRGEIFIAPYDVVLSQHDIVQPDILFVSYERRHLITELNLQGTPDLIVEILSPSTQERDKELKKKLYARFGVREYWIVDPDKRIIQIFILRKSGYGLKGTYGEGESFESEVIRGLVVEGKGVFSL